MHSESCKIFEIGNAEKDTLWVGKSKVVDSRIWCSIHRKIIWDCPSEMVVLTDPAFPVSTWYSRFGSDGGLVSFHHVIA